MRKRITEKISRLDVYKLLTKCKIKFCTKEQLVHFIETEFNEETLEAAVLDMVACEYQGVSNGFLSDLYEAIIGQRVEVIGEVSELFTCPCCGKKTLSELHYPDLGTGWDICPFCNWEDDGTKESNIRTSVNRGAIADYRSEIEKNPNFYFRDKWFTKEERRDFTLQPIAHYLLAATLSGFMSIEDCQLWADKRMESREKVEHWILDVSLAKSIEELRKALTPKLEREQRSTFCPPVSDSVIGFYYFLYDDEEIYTILKEVEKSKEVSEELEHSLYLLFSNLKEKASQQWQHIKCY